MDRRRFLATVGAASVAARSGAAIASGSARAGSAAGGVGQASPVDERFLKTLTAVNDLQVPATLSAYQAQIDGRSSPRTLAQSALRLVTAFVNPRGRRHHDAQLLGPIGSLVDELAARQNPSGLYDIGNLDSPPDTAFVISDLGISHDLLRQDAESSTVAIRDKYAGIMDRATTSLVTGGVHTPNHRWEICKALAHLCHLRPNKAAAARIDEWLSEGIDQDDEGEYSERSPNYASEVTNRSLAAVARLLGRPGLLQHVGRNLEMTLFRLEPNGEVETVQSRRQDQTGVQEVWKYLMQFRELALSEREPRFAAVVEGIIDRVEANPASFAVSGYSVGEFLAEAIAYPDLSAPLPAPVSVPADYQAFSRGSQLVRVRRGGMTASIFGGTDWHNERRDTAGHETTIREIASGLSTNPTFFKFRKGAAILQSVRLSPNFFGTGHFRSDGVTAERGGWRLGDTVRVPYHQPLAGRYHHRDGDYALTADGRFYSKMDFPHREKQYLVLSTTVTISEVGRGGFDLAFAVDGPRTSLTIELCFREGGRLTGVVPAGTGNFQLVEGEGVYTAGQDTITFGPGNGSGPLQPVRMDAGEKYSYLAGSLVPSGQRVYITGTVPFRYTLRLR